MSTEPLAVAALHPRRRTAAYFHELQPRGSRLPGRQWTSSFATSATLGRTLRDPAILFSSAACQRCIQFHTPFGPPSHDRVAVCGVPRRCDFLMGPGERSVMRVSKVSNVVGMKTPASSAP